ncbi:MAG: cysteine--tRNA ligase [Rothia sp. (in: high G+C Gram-positive bacteria)]|uniref:cysteine--tRNA ligase n=1 Tax=Rothia sp. (in: high G+C Gram-positive bacteria) TaxID=1885016 RepID=UPI002708BECB|nr:cysteine--tRNA ligase [Rothia sp. (in: high G+C Gram-positive bacteria)]
MTLRFYDSATASVRDFTPVHPGEARIYYCGATVQGAPHIGHVRSGLVFDQLSRWLTYRGYKVTTVRNVTDIDDKILVNSAASFEPGYAGEHPAEEWWALAYRFERVFGQAYASLNIAPPTYEPRATGHIPEMFALIQRLIDRGHAYPATDGCGDVYFDVRSWENYGALTRQKIDDMQDAPDADPRGKRDPRDFALWKAYKEGEPVTASWDSPWGKGRPGWHLECSAMAGKYLGETFDIHGGGLDLRFPHHENEMAQSQAAGYGFANFWMHNGLVNYEGEKMSKSIGNIITPAQMLEAARPLVVRYYLGQAHYRSVLDYHPTSLEEARVAVERVEAFLAATRDYHREDAAVPEAFAEAMDDDLNIPKALAALHAGVRAGNAALAAGESAQDAAEQVYAMAKVLGLVELMSFSQAGAAANEPGEHAALDSLIQTMLTQRAEAREAKDWARADQIRDALAAAGITVKDGASGSTWSL